MSRTNTILQVATLIAVALLIYRVQLNPEIKVAGNGDLNSKPVQSEYVKLSDEADRELANIEATLANKNQRPESRDKVQALHDRLASIVNGLSPASQERMLPRLVPRRWEIQALWLMAKDNDPPNEKFQEALSLADEMNLLHASAPIDSSEDIRRALQAQEKLLRDRAAKVEYASVVDRAKAAISSNDSGKINDSIRELASSGEEEATKLRLHLYLLRDIKLLAADLDQIEKIGDRELREYGFGRLKQQVLDLKLQSELVKSKYAIKEKPPALHELEKRVSNEINRIVTVHHSDLNKKQMKYQQWALGQIKEVKTYDQLKQAALSQIGNPIYGTERYRLAEKSAKDELTTLLKFKMAPINPVLLDEAVGTWYRKVFQDRFDKLDTQQQQTVINDFASTEKKSIEK